MTNPGFDYISKSRTLFNVLRSCRHILVIGSAILREAQTGPGGGKNFPGEEVKDPASR